MDETSIIKSQNTCPRLFIFRNYAIIIDTINNIENNISNNIKQLNNVMFMIVKILIEKHIIH